jgi:quercetin dioxygenase-like cupin family protein
MYTVDVDGLEFFEQEGKRHTFPMHEGTGHAGSAVVVFELDPGVTLGSHTDSAEEILLVLQGTAEATVGEETGTLSAGQMALVPASVPHNVRNTGSETLRVVGFFAASAILSRFEEPLGPGAPQVFVNGAPPEVPVLVAG